MARIVLSGEPLVDGPTALRPWRDSDLEALVLAGQDPDIARWTGMPDNYAETDARAYLIQRHDAIHAGTLAPFAIMSASEGRELLGSISLMGLAWEHGRAEVGYWLAREARGYGHITRAVGLICRWGFESLKLERIDLFAATGNPASQRVAERAGFTREAVLRSYFRGKDGLQDMVAYGLLADETSH
jgi:RimJ/RimL family protein N-acetyltransferase